MKIVTGNPRIFTNLYYRQSLRLSRRKWQRPAWPRFAGKAGASRERETPAAEGHHLL